VSGPCHPPHTPPPPPHQPRLPPATRPPTRCPPAADCGHGTPCTDDTCNTATGACQHANNTAPCSDGASCTVGDVCSGGVCQPGTATDSQCGGTVCAPLVCDPTNINHDANGCIPGTPPQNCCTSDTQCSDTNPYTGDSSNTSTAS